MITNYDELTSWISPIIQDAMKNKDAESLKAYRNIKSDLEYAKGNKVPFQEALEALYKSRKKLSADWLEKGNSEVYQELMRETEILEKLLPEKISPELILNFLNESGLEKTKQNFRNIQNAVKEKFGQAPDSSIILKYIES